MKGAVVTAATSSSVTPSSSSVRCSSPSRQAKDRELGDDHIHSTAGRERVGALGDDLGLPARRGRCHRDDHPSCPHDEVHRAADAEDILAGHGPVRDVATGAHLESAEDGDVNMAAADHREAGSAVEVRGARQRGDRQLRSVDQIRIDLTLARAGADPEQAVLGMQHDPRVGGEKARDEVRDADPEVDDVAGLELPRGPRGDP